MYIGLEVIIPLIVESPFQLNESDQKSTFSNLGLRKYSKFQNSLLHLVFIFLNLS